MTGEFDPAEVGEWIAEAPSAQLAAGRGRPTTLSREEVLCHVWRLVYRQMELSGVRNASKACRRLMQGTLYRDRLFRFTDPLGREIGRIAHPDQLRKAWQAAERLRRTSGPSSLISQFVVMTMRDVAAEVRRKRRR